REPAAARQLASRARRRIRGAEPPLETDHARQRAAVDAFLSAARDGDFDALLEVLDPDVVFRIDAGGVSPRARPPLRGAEMVARQIVERGTAFAPLARPATVNGAAGAVVAVEGRPFAVVAFSVAGDRIVAIDLVLDPKKLERVSLP